jgi:hypothetical protein
VNESKEKGWWPADIGDASPDTCLVAVERGAEWMRAFRAWRERYLRTLF